MGSLQDWRFWSIYISYITTPCGLLPLELVCTCTYIHLPITIKNRSRWQLAVFHFISLISPHWNQVIWVCTLGAVGHEALARRMFLLIRSDGFWGIQSAVLTLYSLAESRCCAYWYIHIHMAALQRFPFVTDDPEVDPAWFWSDDVIASRLLALDRGWSHWSKINKKERKE